MNEFFRITIGILLGIILIVSGIYAITINGQLIGIGLIFTGICCAVLTIFGGK